MIRTIILDLDGPVLDGKLRHYTCYSDILRENGFTPMPMDQYWEMKRNRCDLREQLKVSGADAIYDLFIQLWLEYIETKEYLRMDRLQPGAAKKLTYWKKQGIHLALATMRNNYGNLHWQLRSLDISDLFDQVVVTGSAHDGSRKAEAVRQRIEPNSSNTIWIGDTEADVTAARQLGIRVITVTCGLRAEGYLRSLEPNYLFPDLQSVRLEEVTSC